jgi:Protein of unknown function (DUF3341)
MDNKKYFGVVGEFADPTALYHAAEKARDAGLTKFDVHSPFPIHGMDKAMGLSDSKLGIIVFIGGICGGTGAFSLMAWVSTTAYKLIISNKPLLSTEAFVPITFALTILLSAFSCLFGMLALNKLPMFHHGVFKHSTFKKFSTDGFFMSIEAEDKKFDPADTKRFMESIGGKNIELIEA